MAEGFHDFAAAEVLTAANTDDYLMRQTVMRFASTAARDSALSGVLVEGLLAYTKDANRFWIYTGSAWQLVGGSLPRCRAHATVLTTIATSNLTAVGWLGESYDTDTIHDNSTNPSRFTIPAAMGGLWHFEATLSWEPGSGTVQASFQVNATGNYWGLQKLDSQDVSNGPANGISADIPVAAGDYVQVFVYQTSGGDVDVQVSGTTIDYCACHFVGPTF